MREMEFSQRRRFLGLAAGAAVFAAAPALAVPRLPAGRVLSFQHMHTGEKLEIVYRNADGYEADALVRINWLLRDFHTGATHPIDPRLLDLLALLRSRLETSAPFQVVSGYRSPKTNARLAREGEGVARNSLHMQGMAVDLRVPERRLAAVRRIALGLHGGGVGYYPDMDFVHIDSGRVRHW